MHLGFTAAHHSSPVPLLLELGVAVAGGIAVLATPRLTLLLRDLVRTLTTAAPHPPRATALHR
jgi:hypothetical protein